MDQRQKQLTRAFRTLERFCGIADRFKPLTSRYNMGPELRDMIDLVAGCAEPASRLRDALRTYADRPRNPEIDSEEHRVQLTLAIDAYLQNMKPLAAFYGRPLFRKQQPILMATLECKKLARSVTKSIAMASDKTT